MTDPLVDVQALITGLRDHEIDYVLFGALAMLFYGYVRTTEDMDILVSPAPANIDRVADWLMSLRAVLKLSPQRSFGPRERSGMKKGSNATVLTPLGQIDVVQRLPGLPDWADVIRSAEFYEVDEIEIPVLNRRMLIELKRNRGSSLDLADIEAIESLPDL